MNTGLCFCEMNYLTAIFHEYEFSVTNKVYW